MRIHSYNQVTIDPQALAHNYSVIRKKTGEGVRILAMVKADGYGHDMIRAARVFAAAGCDAFGVAETGEGVALREAGITGDILIMLGPAPEHGDLVVRHRLTPVVSRIETAELLSRAASAAGVAIGIHMKVDTGMSRLGLLPDQVDGFLDRIGSLPGVYPAGIVSHFSQADDLESADTGKSYALYRATCERIREKCSGIRHIANSGGIFNFPETCADMVRPGIALYGYYPDGRAGATRETGERLRPAMSFATRVIQVKSVPAGSGVSYGHTYVTPHKTRLAVLPVGYEDGYLRSLSNTAEVLIRGRRAPIRGRICMNLCMADVTAIPEAAAGDEAVLLGAQGDDCITADEIAQWAGTISYEVLCLFGNNNERRYKDNEK